MGQKTVTSDFSCFTSASFAYLDRARVLGTTLREHHPDWTLWLCLPDEEPPGFVFDASAEPFDYIVRLHELKIPNQRSWIFEHDLVELCTAVKGPMLCHLLASGSRKVLYLDPDIAVLNDLGEIATLLDSYNVLLTPHQLQPDEASSAIMDNEIGSLKHGIYNLGFLAVANTAEGNCFARWWRDRLLRFCFDDIPGGLFTDQRWCDHVPNFFSGVHAIRDPGYNVASWNLSRRPISIGRDGIIYAADRPLRFFHFTKVTSVGETMIERYSGNRIEVFEMMHWYRALLAEKAVAGLPEGWWAYGHYRDGKPIIRKHRAQYRARPELQQRYPDPFAAGPGIFA
jgi:hypothetical protein